ncbi:MAG: hypothetical protein IT532_02690 [Burkholderiales bacterium]|nr:hypothetical protein [Burkholderiales bacterium]
MDSYTLLSSLEKFLREREVAIEGMTADPMLMLMFDWYRQVKVDRLDQAARADVLVYRYGGWSEGCATGYRFSLMRRVTAAGDDGPASFNAGITLMFDPGRLGHLEGFSATSTEYTNLDAFLEAIESSPAYKALAGTTPMGAMLEMGALR